MDSALHEIPLALFTTLGPMSAGAFVALFMVFARNAFEAEHLRRIDRFTFIPVSLAIIGLIGSFAHLANPGNALNVLRTIGSSPLANEVLCFGIFLALAFVYWLVALAGGLKSQRARMAFAGIVAIAGLIAVVFMGLAYLIPTIPVWNSPKTVFQLIGAWLFGGVALGMLVCSLAGKKSPAVNADELACKIAMIIGAIVFVSATMVIFAAGSGAIAPTIDASANARSLLPIYMASIVLSVLSALCGLIGKGTRRPLLFASATILAGIAIFLGRMTFYGMQIGIGL